MKCPKCGMEMSEKKKPSKGGKKSGYAKGGMVKKGSC